MNHTTRAVPVRLPTAVPRTRLAAYLFAAFTIDMLFLPMFHAAGLPFKPFYLALAFYLPVSLLHRQLQPVTLLWWLLAVFCLAGGLYLRSRYDGVVLRDTLRNCLVFFLVPPAFALGWRLRLPRLDVLALLLPLYFALNLTLTIEYQRLPWLIHFYGLDSWLERGLFEVRSPGIHFNPNLSALAANLMLLGIVMAERYRGLRLSGRFTPWLVFFSVMGVHLLMGSRGETLSGMLLGAAWVSYRAGVSAKRRILRQGLRLAASGAFVLLLLAFTLPFLAARVPMFEWIERQLTGATSLFSLEQLTDPALRGDSVIMRPFMEIERVGARFRESPVWGTGFDVVPNVAPFDYTYFHNDWSVVLVAGGIVGLLLLLFAVRRFGRLGWPMLIPFVLTASANSFILAPQHLIFYGAVAGWVAHRRWESHRAIVPDRTRAAA